MVTFLFVFLFALSPWAISFFTFNKIPQGLSIWGRQLFRWLGITIAVGLVLFFVLITFFSNSGVYPGVLETLILMLLTLLMFFIGGIRTVVKGSSLTRRDEHPDILDS